MNKCKVMGQRQAAIGVVLLFVAACGDPAPAAKPDSAQGADADISVDVGSDIAPGSDAKADSLAADTGSDTSAEDVADIDSPGTDASAVCPGPCIDSDDNPCTYAVCDAGACATRTLSDGSSCEDGNPCTVADTCQQGSCQASTAPGSNLCGCATSADCAAQDDGLLCNGQFFCDKSAFPYTCKVNPVTLPPCDIQTSPAPCLVAACQEPAVAGGKAQCVWQPQTDGKPCDDGNPLTEGDICLQGSCQSGLFVGKCQTNADCGKYEDGDLCNGQLFCNKAKAQCQLNPSTIVACPTGQDSTCRKNTCAPATGQCSLVATANGQLCEDGNACTASETCQAGACVSATNLCKCSQDADCAKAEDGNLCNGTLYCNLSNGTCAVNPASVVQCEEPTEPCQQLVCVPATGICQAVQAPDSLPCNADNSFCTPGDACSDGACIAGVNVCKCASSKDCALFEDGDACNGTLYCDLTSGTCALNPSTIVTCDSSLDTACTEQQCLPLSGDCSAVAVHDGAGCDDGDSCSLGDSCLAGTCQPGQAACGCLADSDCADKEDGNLCNGKLFCNLTSKLCQLNPATVVNCTDASPDNCAITSCEPATGLCVEVTATIGTSCEDGDDCTTGEICGQGGICGGGDNSCGCQSDLDCTFFDDGNACNGTVICDQAAKPVPQCALTAPVVCSAPACQLATCEPATGACVLANAVTASGCDDADACTSLDQCLNGACVGQDQDCDDANACTADLCAAGDCQHVPVANQLPCDDEDACSLTDICVAGECQHTWKDCGLGNNCQVASCMSDDGSCSYTDASGPCDDGDACSLNDACLDGDCVGQPLTCDPPQGAPCLQSACQNGSCQVTAKPDNTPCNDGDLCTLTGSCGSGTCVATTTITCFDGDPCTSDPPCSGGVCTPVTDGNSAIYWQSDFETDGAAMEHLAHGPAGWLVLGSSEGGSSAVWSWPSPGVEPNFHYLNYKGANRLLAASSQKTGVWYLFGQHIPSGTEGDWLEQGAQALIQRYEPAKGLVASWAGLKASTSVRLAYATDTPGRFVVAGTTGAASAEYDASAWIAEVDLTGAQPVIVQQGQCSMPYFRMRPHVLLPMSDGGWMVAGEAAGGEGTFDLYNFRCRFGADLTKPITYEGGSNNFAYTHGFVRANGDYWLFALSNAPVRAFEAYRADGRLIDGNELTSSYRAAVGTPDGWLAALVDPQDPDTATLQLFPLATSFANGPVTELAVKPANTLQKLLADTTGLAWLESVPADFPTMRLVHADNQGSTSCGMATTCLTGCEGAGACETAICTAGGCVVGEFACNDNDPCTADSCGEGGCIFDDMEGQPCSDGLFCVDYAVCTAGQCVGNDRLGTVTLSQPASLTVVDAVAAGDQLILVGHRDINGQSHIVLGAVDEAGNLLWQQDSLAGQAVALARSASVSGFANGGQIALLARDLSGNYFVSKVDVFGQSASGAELVPALAELAANPLLQSADGHWQLLARNTQGALTLVYTRADLSGVRTVSWGSGGQTPVGLAQYTSGELVAVSTSFDSNTTYGQVYVDHLASATGSDFSPTAGVPLPTDPLDANAVVCTSLHRTATGVMANCASNRGVFYAMEGDPNLANGDTSLLPAFSRGGKVPVAATGTPRGAVEVTTSDAESVWTVRPHDGYFNGLANGEIVADRILNVSASERSIWVLAEVDLPGKAELQVTVLDRWGNDDCAQSADCYLADCPATDSCQQVSCSGGTCQEAVGYVGNCGSLQSVP